ncbi:MAG: diguanylate cyclase [Burkholderiaceae bacterium]
MPLYSDKSEDLRLRALARHELLDSGAEAAFDAMTFAATRMCGAQIGLISLVDHQRQWFKSAVGLEQGSETPREHAFCAHAIEDPDSILEVRDATLDARFANNPLVTGDPNIRFYAGVPVKSSDGLALGTLCVINRKPGALSDEQRQALTVLGRGVEALFAERMQHLQARQRLATLYLDTPALLYLLDGTGAIIEVSHFWRNHLGYHPAEVIGRNAREFMTLSSRKEFLRVRETFWARGGCLDYPCQFVKKNGEVIDTLMSASIECDNLGRPERVRCVLVDVTHQVRLQRELEQLSRTDELTGIANRGWFRKLAGDQLHAARISDKPLSLVTFDVDYFKRLNDRFGHAQGDLVLSALAAQTTRLIDDDQVVGRIGGDEFSVLLPGVSELDALLFAEKLRLQAGTGPRLAGTGGPDDGQPGSPRPIPKPIWLRAVRTNGPGPVLRQEAGRNQAVVWKGTLGWGDAATDAAPIKASTEKGRALSGEPVFPC